MRTLNNQERTILGICSQTSLSLGKIKTLIYNLPDLSIIFAGNLSNIPIVRQSLTENDIIELNNIDEKRLDAFIHHLAKQNIEIVTFISDIYPKNLKEIHSAPVLLYAKGNLDLLSNSSNLAVVGTRRCTNYGREVTTSFVKDLVKHDICIVSGLADGVDAIAHEAALANGGKTIAVIGSGFNNIYPSINTALSEQIIKKGGLLLSEYEPGEKPNSYHFPARNRIVAALSMALLLVEAPERSGALITKEYAMEFNREVFVVPGRITDYCSKGCNDVIQLCQGTMVLSPKQILDYYGKTVVDFDKPKDVAQLSLEEEMILQILGVNDLHYEAILVSSGMSSGNLNALLMKMELKNLIKKLPGNIYTSVKI